MRSMCRTVLVVLVAVFALSAVTASAALAAPEWYSKTGGVFKKVTSLEVKSTTKITVNDTGWFEGEKMTCEGTMEGTIEAGGLGKINHYTVSHCTSKGHCETEGSILVEPVNLPWKTELYSVGGQYRDRIVSGGSGTPEWEFTCEVSHARQSDVCGFNTSAKIFNNGQLGSVEESFDAGSNRTRCSKGGAEAGKLEGTISLPHPTGVEAIEVSEGKTFEWRQGGAPLSEAVGTKWNGPLALADKEGVTVECEDTGEGTAGLGAAGTVTKWTASHCTSKGSCESQTVEAVDLPWHSELSISEGGGTTQDVITGAGKGEPGYKSTCVVFGIKVIETCKAPTLSIGVENVTSGVRGTFDGKKLNCSRGGEGEGSLEGTQFIEATKGGKLEVK